MSDSAQWLTVSQAAAALEVSERTIRRRCDSGRLAARLATTDNGKEWQIEAAAVGATDISADTAASELRTSAATIQAGADTQTVAAAIAADAAANELRTGAAIAAANTADTSPTAQSTAPTPVAVPLSALDARDELISELRENAVYLRGQIEAQRLQIEAANRATSEAHAALREALKMSHRALNEGTAKPVEIDGNSDQHIEAQVLAGRSDGATESREFPARYGAMDKAVGSTAVGARKGSAARDGTQRRARGFRGWLLQVLAGK